MTTAPFPVASCPHAYHSLCALLEKSSILFWVGCILEIRSINFFGFAECLVLFSCRNCLSFLAPLGLGIAPFVPTIHISTEDIV